MLICTQEHNPHCIQKKYFELFCSQSCSIFFCITCNFQSKSHNKTIKTVELGHQILFSQTKFDSLSNLKMNIGILPISLFFDYRAANYCHSILNKKKPAFSSSALKLPTESFYIHGRTQQIFTQTISKCSLHEKKYY